MCCKCSGFDPFPKAEKDALVLTFEKGSVLKNYLRLGLLAPLLVVALALTSCGASGSGGDMQGMDHSGERDAQKTDDIGGMNGMNHDYMNHGSGQQGVSIETVDPAAVGLRVEFTSAPVAPLPGQPVELRYRVTVAESSRALTDLPIDHERPMHLIATSKDLTRFQHIHPEVGSGEAYGVVTEFPEAGTYVLYDEFKHGGRTVLDRRELRVGEGSADSASLSIDLTPKTVGGVEVSLAVPEPINAGEEANFTFTLTRDGQPVNDLEPYLGAAAHVAIASADTQQFAHTHGEAAGGDDVDAQRAGGDGHEGHEDMGSSDSGEVALGPEITFHHTFPSPGLYKVWGQFSHDGRVITVPYVVEVT